MHHVYSQYLRSRDLFHVLVCYVYNSQQVNLHYLIVVLSKLTGCPPDVASRCIYLIVLFFCSNDFSVIAVSKLQ